jgi:carboxyl-terminal processing protease
MAKLIRYSGLLALALAILSCKLAANLRQSPTPPTFNAQPSQYPTLHLATIAPTATSLPSATLPPTLPAAPTFTFTPIPSPTELAPTAALDPNTVARQLKVFEELWQIVRDRYLYPDFNGLNWETVGAEYRSRIADGMTDEDFYQTLREMIRRLGDEHSVFFSPQEAAERDREFQGQYNYVGIGVMTALIPERQRLVILLTFPGSPAEEAGLRAHDSILSVDGLPAVDESGPRQSLLRGPEGSIVELSVQTPGEPPRQVRITRRPVNAQLPLPHTALTSPGGRRIGYLFIPTFNDTFIDEMVGQALDELSAGGALEGLVIDNRYNGGGASDVLLNTLGYFTTGPVGTFIENRQQIQLRAGRQQETRFQNLPLVVLIGPGTASFGEVFAGALKDLGRAYLIGEQTEGNVEVLSIFDLSDGSRAWIATSTFRPLNHPNQNWEETGIIPDRTVRSAWDEFTLETDPAILSALQYFDGTLSNANP